MGVSAFAKTETVKGQLIDQECYLMEKKVETDPTCAVQCGAPSLASRSRCSPPTVRCSMWSAGWEAGWLAANTSVRLTAHMLQTLEITGDVTTKDGKLSIPVRGTHLRAAGSRSMD